MNRKRLLPLIAALTLVTLLISTCGAPPGDREGAALSLEEAAQLVLAEVVKPDDLDHEVIVFPWPEPLEPGDRLHSYLGPDLESPGEVLPIGNEAWFFWVDDAPGAASAHPTRFVLVDRATGEVSTSEEEWWPVLNGESLWVETEVYWDEANWAFSNVEWRPSKLDLSLHPHHLAKPLRRRPLVNGSPGAALVVNVWREGETLEEDMQTSAEGMHESYSLSGFDTEYIGPPRGPAGRLEILGWIYQQSQLLQPCQTAIIYIVGHGGSVDGEGGVGLNLLTETDLADALRQFNPGVHVIVTIDSCYSGSWISSLREVADITITSTGAHDYMYGDYDPVDWLGNPLDKNPWDVGTEFTSGLKEDWDQIMADPAERERVEARAERNNENFWEALHAESYLTALEKDACYHYLGTFPNMVRMIPVPEATPILLPTYVPTGEPWPTPTFTPPPDQCSADADCDEGVCEDGQCVVWECDTDWDCYVRYGEYVCVFGECVPEECATDEDCVSRYGEGWRCLYRECVETDPPLVQEPEVSFTVDPSTISLGDCALMSWTVTNHELWQVSTNHHTVDPSGEQEVCPEESTTYELRVELDGVSYVFPVTLRVELPTPTPPPTETTATLIVTNHCGTPLYFTIAGTMYEVAGNSYVSIGLPPDQHPFTISMPGFDDHNDTIDIEAGKSYGLPITCCVTSLGTPKKGCE